MGSLSAVLRIRDSEGTSSVDPEQKRRRSFTTSKALLPAQEKGRGLAWWGDTPLSASPVGSGLGALAPAWSLLPPGLLP